MTQTQFSYEAIAAAHKKLSEDRVERETDSILDQVEDHGDDDFPAGTVFRFSKSFTGTDKVYTYAAIKVVDLPTARKPVYWTVTGNSSASYTWDEFTMWLVTEGLPVSSDEIEVLYPKGYEPPVKHVCNDNCRADADRFINSMFGGIFSPFGVDAEKADADADEPLSDSEIVLASTGEDTEDEAAEAADIQGDRVEDVTTK